VRGVLGLWPAARDGDDVLIYAAETRTDVRRRIPFLRQQRRSHGGRPNLSLADFVAPVGGPPDWLGGFVVAVHGAEALAAAAEARGDDYAAILAKAVADRLAEAAAERLHRQVRRVWWGYAPREELDLDALLAERYRGIRPAPGYPACPEHLAKRWIFALLEAEAATGARLTESCAMIPAASVAGWYFAHPEARYFGLGRVGRDQVADWARRAELTTDEAARWLAPHLD
jgi:5-methyltetrahydrofolate--homocysteine methyltransferase